MDGNERESTVSGAPGFRLPDELGMVRLLALIVTAAALVAGFFILTSPASGRPSGGDFVGFYVPAQIVRMAPQRLYDLELQRQMRVEVTGVDSNLPYAHAPFLAIFMTPFAALPFRVAYVVWMVFSAILYGASVLLLAPVRLRKWALPFAFVCPIFSLYVMVAGQVTAIDCFAVATAIHLERKGLFFLSGAALTLCAHKPVLLVFAVAMLFFTRHYRSLLGVGAGVGLLAAISLLVVGPAGCLEWMALVLRWGKVAREARLFSLSMYVDLNSFSHLLPAPPLVSVVAGVLLAGTAAASIGYMWRAESREVVWAATLTAPLLLNVYAGRWETVLFVLAVVLLSHVKTTDWTEFLIGICVTALIALRVANTFGVQPLTLAMVGTLLYGSVLAARCHKALVISRSYDNLSNP